MLSTDRFRIAIDLGTTTIAAALLDTATGTTVARAGALNPQRPYGLDVLARLTYAATDAAHLQELQRCINQELELLCRKVAAEAAIPLDAVALIAIAGNPAMVHLLLALPVATLAHPPYRPKITSGHHTSTGSLGWSADIPLYVFPSPGGFVGGDMVAFLYEQLVSRPEPAGEEATLFLDLGTNGEMALLTAGKWFATSAAAGPAFEAGNLACGMAALPGAVERVKITGERVTCTSIGGGLPVGICGSGVLDAISALLQAELLDVTGRLKSPAEIPNNLASRLQEIGGEPSFVLHRDARHLVYLSQADIRQVQLAKAAVRGGIEVLITRSGIQCEALNEVVLTGSFGASLTLESLKTIGILTENMVRKSSLVRDGALAGVVRMLASVDAESRVEELASALKIVPLSGTPAFEQQFISHLNFPG